MLDGANDPKMKSRTSPFDQTQRLDVILRSFDEEMHSTLSEILRRCFRPANLPTDASNTPKKALNPIVNDWKNKFTKYTIHWQHVVSFLYQPAPPP